MVSKQLLSLTFIGVILLAGCATRPIIFDDFSSPDAFPWTLEADAEGSTSITNGQLYIANDGLRTTQYAIIANQNLYELEVEVDAVQIEGTTNNNYGILFRVQENGAFYRFAITSGGKYAVQKHAANGEWRHLNASQTWQPSQHINRGNNATNHLVLKASGNRTEIFVNGGLLETIENFDIDFGAGSVGLDAGTFSEPGLRVAYDNFVLRKP